jgi:hypothetical protein
VWNKPFANRVQEIAVWLAAQMQGFAVAGQQSAGHPVFTD